MKSFNLFLMLMIWPAATQAENLGFFGEIHGGEWHLNCNLKQSQRSLMLNLDNSSFDNIAGEYPQFDWLEYDFKHTSSGQLQGEVVEGEGDQQIERAHKRHHQPQPHTGQTCHRCLSKYLQSCPLGLLHFYVYLRHL